MKMGEICLTSAFVYTGIACLIFYYLLKKRIGTDFKNYSLPDTAAFWVFMRICPLFMLETRTMMNYGCLAADTIILVSLTVIVSLFVDKNAGKTAAALYIFSPLPIVGIIGGILGCTLISFAAAAVLCIVYVIGKNLGKNSAADLVNEYVLLSAGEYLILSDIKSGGTSELFGSGKFPVFAAAGAALLILTAVLTVRKIGLIRKGKAPCVNTANETELHKKSLDKRTEVFGKKDIVLMSALTAIYAAAVFFRLGSFSVPQTKMDFAGADGKRDIIIDLGEYDEVSCVDVFLGYKGGAEIALSAFDENAGEWVLIDKDIRLDYPFEWNRVPVGQTLRYIGAVFTDEEVSNAYCVSEIVVISTNGERIMPVNTAEYPELFDEQELYPKHSTYYDQMIFDEIYHGRTAYEFLNGLPLYEVTHPPLGKIMISVGIALFGMNPFGWRFVPALIGTLIVPIVYLFCRKISGRTDIAFIGAALFCTEFMHYTLSRIATIDIIAAMFIMLMFFFMYCFVGELDKSGSLTRQYVWLLLCGASTALAVSVKWTGVFAAIGIAVIFFVNVYEKCAADGGLVKNKDYLSQLLMVCVVSFIMLPAAVYCLSYIPVSRVYTDENIVELAVDNAKYMLDYHSGEISDHPFSSEWYEWLTDKRPVLDAFTYISEENSVSTISTFGNPLLLLVGLAAVLHNIQLWRIKGCRTARTLVTAYLAMLMPWMFIHRAVFIYQYFVCIIILILLISNSLVNMKKPSRNGLVLLGASLVLFILFFPVISGAEVDREFVSKCLEWLPTWQFE